MIANEYNICISMSSRVDRVRSGPDKVFRLVPGRLGNQVMSSRIEYYVSGRVKVQFSVYSVSMCFDGFYGYVYHQRDFFVTFPISSQGQDF
jgi:hypothetical protein